jgi:hypothetical protein
LRSCFINLGWVSYAIALHKGIPHLFYVKGRKVYFEKFPSVFEGHPILCLLPKSSGRDLMAISRHKIPPSLIGTRSLPHLRARHPLPFSQIGLRWVKTTVGDIPKRWGWTWGKASQPGPRPLIWGRIPPLDFTLQNQFPGGTGVLSGAPKPMNLLQ